MASRSVGSNSAPHPKKQPVVSSNFTAVAAPASRVTTPGGPPVSYASRVREGGASNEYDFENSTSRDAWVAENPHYVASGVKGATARPPTSSVPLSVADLAPPPSVVSRAEFEAVVRAQTESKLTEQLEKRLLQLNTQLFEQSQEHAREMTQLRETRQRLEDHETKLAEQASRFAAYPDDLSEGVPESVVLSVGGPYQTRDKLNVTTIQNDVLISILTDTSNMFPYGDSNSSGVLRSRLVKDAGHFASSGQLYFFHVMAICPAFFNRYLAAQALADPSLKNDPTRLIEFLCYRFSYGYVKGLKAVRGALPKTQADQASFLTALSKVDLRGLFGDSVAPLYSTFFVRIGIMGPDAPTPDVDYTALAHASVSGGQFSTSVLSSVAQRPLQYLRFKEELTFADQLTAGIAAGQFTSGSTGAVHTVTTSRAPSASGRSAERRTDSDRRSDARSSSDRGGRGRLPRSSSRPRPKFRQFTFGKQQLHMCHSFYKYGHCGRRGEDQGHKEQYKHWSKGSSPALDTAFASWEQERSDFEESSSARAESPVPSDTEDEIPSDH